MNKSLINQLIQGPLAYFNPQNPAPWLDQKNALSQLEKQLNKKQITSQQYDLLKHWTSDRSHSLNGNLWPVKGIFCCGMGC